MKILLTGATGFLGSHLAKAFVNSGYEVHAIVRKSSNFKRLENIIKDIKFYFMDSDIDKTLEAGGGYNVVVHTATCYGREGNDENISEANFILPSNLLKYAAKGKADVFINTDTFFSKVDSKPDYLNDYVLSKKRFLNWSKGFVKEQKIAFINIIVEHMYGPLDSPSKFTTTIINDCLSQRAEIELTPGEQKRDFIYVEDVVSAYQAILAEKKYPCFEEIEVGNGESVSIKKFVEQVHRITKSNSLLKFSALPYRDNEIMESKANLTKIRSYGWNSMFSLEEGLKKTIEAEIENID